MSTTRDVSLQFLARNRGLFYCWLCVVKATGLSAYDHRPAWAELVTDSAIELSQAQCTQCMQVRTVARVKIAGQERPPPRS